MKTLYQTISDVLLIIYIAAVFSLIGFTVTHYNSHSVGKSLRSSLSNAPIVAIHWMV